MEIIDANKMTKNAIHFNRTHLRIHIHMCISNTIQHQYVHLYIYTHSEASVYFSMECVAFKLVLGFKELIKLAGFAFRPALKELRRASAQAYACCVCKVMFISFVFMCFNMLRI